MFTLHSRLLVLTALFATASFAQQQKEPPSVRDYCVKVPQGKNLEFEAYAKEVAIPLNQARIDNGEATWFLVARGVMPVGSSAKCDYRVVYGYAGLPPESSSIEQTEAALKRAKLSMTVKELFAKRDALTQLVDLGIWSGIDRIGGTPQKGNFVRLNHYSVKPADMEAWRNLESTYWKPLVEAWNKAGGKGTWSTHSLMMPEGDNLPYNAQTVDTFSDWNSMLHGVPFDSWSKVHATTDVTSFLDRLDRVRVRHDIEVYKVIEAIGPASK